MKINKLMRGIREEICINSTFLCAINMIVVQPRDGVLHYSRVNSSYLPLELVNMLFARLNIHTT